MTNKQTTIAEGIDDLLQDLCNQVESTSLERIGGIGSHRNAILQYLHSQGVVIKVDKEEPHVYSNGAATGIPWEIGFEQGVTEQIRRFNEAGYAPVEPLIEE